MLPDGGPWFWVVTTWTRRGAQRELRDFVRRIEGWELMPTRAEAIRALTKTVVITATITTDTVASYRVNASDEVAPCAECATPTTGRCRYPAHFDHDNEAPLCPTCLVSLGLARCA